MCLDPTTILSLLVRHIFNIFNFPIESLFCLNKILCNNFNSEDILFQTQFKCEHGFLVYLAV